MAERPMRFARKKRLGELLIDAGVLTQENLDKALEEQKKSKGLKLGSVLVDMGIVSEWQMVRALCDQLGYEEVRLSTLRISEDVTKVADEAVLRKYCLIPFGFSEKNPNILKVAMSDPLDIRAMDDISVITGFQVEIYVTTQHDIAATIDRYYGNAAALRRCRSSGQWWQRYHAGWSHRFPPEIP